MIFSFKFKYCFSWEWLDRFDLIWAQSNNSMREVELGVSMSALGHRHNMREDRNDIIEDPMIGLCVWDTQPVHRLPN